MRSIRRIFCTLLTTALGFGWGANAYSQVAVLSEESSVTTNQVVVVMQQNQQVHSALVESFLAAQKEQQQYDVNVLTAREFRDQILTSSTDFNPRLIVSLGTEITDYIVGLELPYPLLSAAIPKLSYQQLRERHQTALNEGSQGEFSAIYLDQPLARSLNLIQTILPETRRVGVSLGPETKHYETEIRAELSKRDLQLSMGQVGSEAQLVNTLDQVLDESDVLLGIVDPLVFSRTSAKNVLLTAYRWRVPLIGISPAYVRAGALASVHATPAQLGVQLADTIETLSNEDFQKLPEPKYPAQFSVSVNYQVAEAMGIQIEDELVLLTQIQALETPLTSETASDD